MEKKPLDQQVVRVMAWLLLYGRAKSKLGAEQWEALEKSVGAPPFKQMDPNDITPLTTFNAALDFIGNSRDQADPSLIAEAADDSVLGWAQQNRAKVQELQGKPRELLDLWLTQVHPWFFNETENIEFIESGPNHMLVKLYHDMRDEFTMGLFTGLIKLVGAKGQIENRGDQLYYVTWQ
ncbi:MAG TPA: hypothetical protein VFQ23_03685 [Anaerolineales bacterium]|nr:hypothetical protein [Anaerolineales bacterium]